MKPHARIGMTRVHSAINIAPSTKRVRSCCRHHRDHQVYCMAINGVHKLPHTRDRKVLSIGARWPTSAALKTIRRRVTNDISSAQGLQRASEETRVGGRWKTIGSGAKTSEKRILRRRRARDVRTAIREFFSVLPLSTETSDAIGIRATTYHDVRRRRKSRA